MQRPLGPIGHCSARLRRALEIEEEEALIGKVRVRRRPSAEDDDRKKKGGGRFLIEPDFAVPGPFSSRPLSPEGHVSFHFTRDTVTKESDKTSVISSSSGQKRLTASAPAEHDGYIGRPDAVMALSAADFDGYAARQVALENVGPDHVAVFSNISDDPEVRRQYWQKVHQYERSPKPDAIEFRRERLSSVEWQRIAEIESLPADVRRVAADIASASPAHMTSVKKKGKNSKSKKPDASLLMDRDVAVRVVKAIREELGHWNSKQPPIRLRKGRGGRTQFRLTAEFADGLDGAGRVRIAMKVCRHLGDLGVMYTAAIHEPNEHNDGRNYHLHVAYHDRPARIMPGTNLWDFEIREKVPHQHNRFRYPHRQPKIANLVRGPDGSNFRQHAADQIYGFREFFATITNEELAKVNNTRLFDPRTYRKMGIDQEPTRPLGPRAAALEAVGIPTMAGIEDAEIIWTAAIQRARRECDEQTRQRNALRTDAARGLADLEKTALHTPLADDLRQAITLYNDAADLLDAHDLEAKEYAVWLQIAEARPQKTIDTCSRILKAIEMGKANRRDQNQEADIKQRQASAKTFLAGLHQIHNANQPIIGPTIDKLERARHQMPELVENLTALLQEDVRHGLAQAPAQEHSGRSDLIDTYATGDHPRDERLEPDATEFERPAKKTEPASPNWEEVRRQIDEVLKRVTDEDLPVSLPDDRNPSFRVPGVSRAEYQLLSAEAFAPWVQDRLAGIAGIQRKRMESCARVLALLGEERLSTTEWARHDLKHYEAYREHPVFQSYYREALRKLGRLTDNVTSTAIENAGTEKRGMRAWLGRVLKPSNDLTDETSRQPSWTPSEPAQAHPKATATNPRADAIASLAEVIRTDPKVELVEVDGALRVKPSSIPEWQVSAAAFETETLIQAAIQDRWTTDMARDNSRLRGAIIAAVQASNKRPVDRTDGKWVVTGIDGRLLRWANEWQDHPELAQAFAHCDNVWTAKETSAVQTRQTSSKTGLSQPTPTAPAAPASTPADVTDVYGAWKRQKGIGR